MACFSFFYEILIKVEVSAKEKFGTGRISPSYLLLLKTKSYTAIADCNTYHPRSCHMLNQPAIVPFYPLLQSDWSGQVPHERLK